jgi:choline dehydrogenase
VPVVAELPGVGLGLQDHPTAGFTWMCEEPVSLKDALNEENLALWATQGGGPLSSNTTECGGFLRTREDLAAPDVQFHMVSGMFVQEGLLPAPAHGFTLSACVLRPQSRGMVAVVSPDPTTKPLIVHNYLAEPEDMRSAVAGVRTVLEIATTEPLSQYAQVPWREPASDSDEDLAAHIRATAQTIYHPTSTCRMGVDDLAVVDPELRVRGVEGLRVVDASIFPSEPRGNTNAPVIAVAERAADLIRGRPAPAPGEQAQAAA